MRVRIDNLLPQSSITITRSDMLYDRSYFGAGVSFRGTTQLLHDARRYICFHTTEGLHCIHSACARISSLTYDERTEHFPENLFSPQCPLLLIRFPDFLVAYYPENPKTAHLEYNRGKTLILPGVQLSGIRCYKSE